MSSSVPAAEAADSACDDDHENDRDTADNEKELQVDLTVSSCEPLATLAAHLRVLDHAVPVLVAQIALGCCCYMGRFKKEMIRYTIIPRVFFSAFGV